jgi:hypothetical protein
MGSNPMKIRRNGKSRWQWLVEGSVRTGAGICPEFGKSGNQGPGISYKDYFFLYLFKKCDKIHNFMHYVQILLKLMP